jgi:hypothetical protein
MTTTADIEIRTIVTKGSVRHELYHGDRCIGMASNYCAALNARGQYVAMVARCEQVSA